MRIKFSKVVASVSRQCTRVRLAAVAGLVAVSGVAAAADPGLDAITALETSATSYIAAAFAVVVIVAGGFWGIGMVKAVMRKSAGG